MKMHQDKKEKEKKEKGDLRLTKLETIFHQGGAVL